MADLYRDEVLRRFKAGEIDEGMTRTLLTSHYQEETAAPAPAPELPAPTDLGARIFKQYGGVLPGEPQKQTLYDSIAGTAQGLYALGQKAVEVAPTATPSDILEAGKAYGQGVPVSIVQAQKAALEGLADINARLPGGQALGENLAAKADQDAARLQAMIQAKNYPQDLGQVQNMEQFAQYGGFEAGKQAMNTAWNLGTMPLAATRAGYLAAQVPYVAMQEYGETAGTAREKLGLAQAPFGKILQGAGEATLEEVASELPEALLFKGPRIPKMPARAAAIEVAKKAGKGLALDVPAESLTEYMQTKAEQTGLEGTPYYPSPEELQKEQTQAAQAAAFASGPSMILPAVPAGIKEHRQNVRSRLSLIQTAETLSNKLDKEDPRRILEPSKLSNEALAQRIDTIAKPPAETEGANPPAEGAPAVTPSDEYAEVVKRAQAAGIPVEVDGRGVSQQKLIEQLAALPEQPAEAAPAPAQTEGPLAAAAETPMYSMPRKEPPAPTEVRGAGQPTASWRQRIHDEAQASPRFDQVRRYGENQRRMKVPYEEAVQKLHKVWGPVTPAEEEAFHEGLRGGPVKKMGVVEPPATEEKYSTAPAAEEQPPAPLTIDHVRRALPAGQVTELPEGGGWEVSLPNERKVRVTPVGEIQVNRAAAERAGQDPEGRALGSWVPIGRDAVIKIVQGDQLDHEVFHDSVAFALSPEELLRLREKYNDDWEAAAIDYNNWVRGRREDGTGGPWRTILDTFKRIADVFYTTGETGFRAVESGKAYRRAPGGERAIEEGMTGGRQGEGQLLRQESRGQEPRGTVQEQGGGREAARAGGVLQAQGQGQVTQLRPAPSDTSRLAGRETSVPVYHEETGEKYVVQMDAKEAVDAHDKALTKLFDLLECIRA